MGPPLPVPCPLYLLNNTRAVEAIGDDTHDELKPAINVLKNPLDLPDFETQLENTRSGFLLKFSSEAAKLLIIWKNVPLDLFHATILFITLPWCFINMAFFFKICKIPNTIFVSNKSNRQFPKIMSTLAASEKN